MGKYRDFVYWKKIDFTRARADKRIGKVNFDLYGLCLYTGKQGSGKTASLVHELDEIHEKYPKCMIVTNFEYKHADFIMASLNDLLTIRNGEDGVVFGIDEIQNEFSSSASKDFPENLLSVITMQRKQRIKILATSQVFGRVAKPLREQCYEVCECRTFFGRWTRARCYDIDDYMLFYESNNKDRKKRKISAKWKKSFVQSDDFRSHYDTYSVIKRMSRQGFTDKQWYELPVNNINVSVPKHKR